MIDNIIHAFFLDTSSSSSVTIKDLTVNLLVNMELHMEDDPGAQLSQDTRINKACNSMLEPNFIRFRRFMITLTSLRGTNARVPFLYYMYTNLLIANTCLYEKYFFGILLGCPNSVCGGLYSNMVVNKVIHKLPNSSQKHLVAHVLLAYLIAFKHDTFIEYRLYQPLAIEIVLVFQML